MEISFLIPLFIRLFSFYPYLLNFSSNFTKNGHNGRLKLDLTVENDFCRLNDELARALQSLSTFFNRTCISPRLTQVSTRAYRRLLLDRMDLSLSHLIDLLTSCFLLLGNYPWTNRMPQRVYGH